MNISLRIFLCCLVVALLCDAEVRAQLPVPIEQPRTFALDLELGLEHSDNPGRFDPSGPDETLLIPRLVLDATRSGRLWQASANGFIEYRHSIDNVFDDEVRANLIAQADWMIVPESLTWKFQDVASVEPIDVTAVDTPDNLQQTNVLITGPAWQIRPSEPWEALLDARFIHSASDEIDGFNSQRLSGSARLLRRVAPTRNASLGAEFTDVAFRDSPTDINDYQRVDAFTRLTSVQARTEIDLAAGHTWIEPDHFQSITSPLLRATLDWRIREESRMRLSARHELSDSVRQLRTSIDDIDLPVATNTRLPVGSEIFELDEVELGWFQTFERGTWSIVSSWRDYAFEREPDLDFREIGAAVVGNWRLTPLTALLGRLEIERRRFDADQRRDTDYR
ncbi:MAG: hypothetical protein ABR550_04245, partial [Wenzhouxiangellaceae bacterium]